MSMHKTKMTGFLKNIYTFMKSAADSLRPFKTAQAEGGNIFLCHSVRKLLAAEQMEMEMVYALAGVFSAI